MAGTQKTIDIIFGAVDNTGSTIKSVGSNLQSLERNIASVSAPLAGVADSILKLDAVLGAAAVGLTAYSIKLSDEFGTAFAEISTLVGVPASELQSFKDDIQTYAESSTASFEEITQATYNAISAGVDYSDSLNVLSNAESLSIAGRADLDTTTRALVSTINAFGGTMEEAGAYSDTFFTVVQKGQTTLPELADSIGQVAPLAAQAGLTFDELGAAIAAVTAGAGVSTSEAVTALKGAISSLIKPTKESSELAAKLGIDFGATALESKGLQGVLQEVAEATGGNVEQMAQLFPNVRSLTAILPLTGTSAGKFTEALEAMKNKQDITSRSAKELDQDLTKLSQTLKNNVTSALISFGDNFTDETASIIQSLTKTFNSIGSELKISDGAFAPLIKQFEGLFQDIESKFAAVAENIPEALDGIDFSNLVRAFDDLGGELGDSFRALFGDVDLTTVEGLEDALQTIVEAFTSLVDVTSGIVSGLEPLFDMINSGASAFSDLSDESKQSAGEMLGFAKTVNTLIPVVGSLGVGIETLGNGLIAMAGVKALPALSQISTLAASINGATGLAKGGLLGAALYGGVSVGEWLNDNFGWSDAVSDFFFDWLQGDKVAESLEGVGEGFKNAGKAANEFAEGQSKAADASEKVAEFVELDIELLNMDIATKIEAAQAQEGLNDEISQSVEVQKESSGTLSIVSDETKKFAEETKKAAQESEEFRLKLLEMASDERIAQIEAKVALDIASLEADTQVAVAIIQTLSDSIQSTGDLLGSLFGNLENATGSKRYDIERQIDLENKLRQDAFNQQKKLTEAQINLLKQKAAQIQRGDALIKVSAENLTPALEMIFNEVLGIAQVRANEQGLEFLTGI